MTLALRKPPEAGLKRYKRFRLHITVCTALTVVGAAGMPIRGSRVVTALATLNLLATVLRERDPTDRDRERESTRIAKRRLFSYPCPN